MGYVIHEILRYADQMSSHQWLWALIAVMVVGAIWLRGFGSRSQY
jgi:hypothetical protein